MNISELQKGALVTFAAREAGEGASLEQMHAICYCVRNRVKAGWYAESQAPWLTAIERAHEHAAHAPTVGGFAVDPNSRAFQMLLRDIDDIFYSQPPEDADASANLEGAIGTTHKFWMFLNRPQSDWFGKHIAGNKAEHQSHAQMGLMMFFE